MYQIHPNARTTPAVRAEILRSLNPPANLPSATASAPRPSANGAGAAPRIVATTPRLPTTRGGGSPTKSALKIVAQLTVYSVKEVSHPDNVFDKMHYSAVMPLEIWPGALNSKARWERPLHSYLPRRLGRCPTS